MPNKTIEKTLLVLLLISAFLSTLSPLWDPDSFWHLASGKYIVENKSLIRTEPFAFTREGEETTDLSWLPHLLFYSVYYFFGWKGTEILVSVIALITMLLLVMIARSQTPTLFSPAFYFGLFFTAFGGRFKLRPEGLSLICFAFLVYLLLCYRSDKLKFRWSFFFLFLIWTQVHPSWIYGLVFIPFFIFEKNGLKLNRTSLTDFCFLILLPVIALFINPYGYKPVFFPFISFITMKSDSSFSIVEWQKSPFTFSTAPFILFAGVLTIFAFVGFLRKKETFLPFAIASLQLFFLISWGRYSSFAFIALSPLSFVFFEWLAQKLYKFKTALYLVSPILLLVPSFSIITYQPTKSLLEINYPEAETNFLSSNGISGNVLHTFVAGGFIELRTYPHCKSFMDGRYFDFLTYINEYENARKNIDLFKAFIEKYPFDIAIMPFTKARITDKDSNSKRNAQALFLPNHTWAPVFYGPYGAVFLKRLPKHQKVIDEYEYKILFPYDKEYIKKTTANDKSKADLLEKELKRAWETGAKFLKE